ncbi:hypothetical protein IX307_002869 [Bacteroides pyogenes]|nr:hypothetical protein [Bacteroides pyogenes]MBR8788515.1 hypothetical protein [Bacteroides pyogenes]MBR8793992.1 hypothetical protein [Bacteroides pyogenes]
MVHIRAQAEGVAYLRIQSFPVLYLLGLSAHYAHVQIFIEHLRGTEAFRISGTEIDVLYRIETQRGAGAYDGIVHFGMFVHAHTQQHAPAVVLPFELCKLAPVVDALIQLRIQRNKFIAVFDEFAVGIHCRIPAADSHIVAQFVAGVFGSHQQLGGHEEKLVEVVRILRAAHIRTPFGKSVIIAVHIVGHRASQYAQPFAVGFQFADSAIIALTVYQLCRGVSLEMMFRIGRAQIVFQVAAIDAMVYLLGHSRHMCGPFVFHMVAAAAKLLYAVHLCRQPAVIGRTQESMRPYRTRVYFTDFGEPVIVLVPRVAVTHPPEEHGSGSLVVAYDRPVERQIVINGFHACKPERLVHGERVLCRFFGDDIQHPRNGRRTEQRRTASAHHLHAVDHIGRNLFQSVHAGKGAHDGARVDKNLCIASVHTVDAHLVEAAVLAVVLHAHARLEDDSLRKIVGIGAGEHLRIDYVHQCRSQTAGGLVAVGGNNYRIERGHILFKIEIQLDRNPFFKNDFLLFCLIPDSFHHNRFLAQRQIHQAEMSRIVGNGTDGCPFQENTHSGDMIARRNLNDMSDDIGIGLYFLISIFRTQERHGQKSHQCC